MGDVKAPQLASVWRSVSLGVSITLPDAELLRRYQTDKTDEDFAALVQRYGRLVWMVCRNLTRCEADADDAFQATFLVFLRNAHKLRDAGKLPAWLHGVAYRICSKVRLSASRRQSRETKRAKSDTVVPVPDSRWDEALAAVQEEVARLPETLRVPFVVCCLEGVGQVEAAKNLGWKLGTLSGRLTRAKDRLMARLEARGVVMTLAGFVAGLALVNAPAASLTKAMLFSTVGAVVPTTILQLSSGVIGMGSTKLKLLLAGFFVTGGLGLGVGSGWINTVGAQQSGGPAKEKIAEKTPQQRALDQEIDQLNAEEMKMRQLKLELEAKRKILEHAKALQQPNEKVKLQADEAKLAAEKAQQLKVVVDAEKLAVDKSVEMKYLFVASDSKDSPKWQYDIVPSKPVSKQDFINFVNTKEKDGWEFVGNNTFVEGGKEQVPSWVFRKPTKPTNVTLDVKSVTGEAVIVSPLSRTTTGGSPTQTVTVTELAKGKPGDDKQPSVTVTGDGKGTFVVEADKKRYEPKPDPKANEHPVDVHVEELKLQIAKLQAQLAKVQQQPKFDVLMYAAKDGSPEATADALDTLTTLSAKKYPNELKVTYQKDTARFVISGSPAAIKWATGMLDKLVGQRPSK